MKSLCGREKREIQKYNKMTEKQKRIQKKYDIELLQQIVERDSITVDLEKNKKISSTVYIDFICHCGKPGNKTFRLMFEKGSLCRECTIELYNIRHKASLKEKTGFEYALQSKETLEKKKETTLKRFGTEHATKTDIIKEKTKNTCLNRYGVEYVSQVKEIREKIKNKWLCNYGVYNPLSYKPIRIKIIQTCLKRYGVEHTSQIKEIREKSEQTSLKRYGVKYALQLQKYKDKRVQTCLTKYGVTSAMKLQSVKDKRTNTSLLRFGVTSAMQIQSIKDKRTQTCLKRYGVESAIQLQKYKDKRVQTCLKRYGVQYVTQAGLPSKGFEFKKYTFPDGKIVYVQGYEPFALDDLTKEGITHVVTCRSEVPCIWYKENGKTHRYYVDIYIPSLNKMIEVKSIWTFNKNKQNVLLKAQECINQNYKYEIWIYDYKKNKEIIHF